MARLRVPESSELATPSTRAQASSVRRPTHYHTNATLSPSPPASSDKENEPHPSQAPKPSMDQHAAKRRRLGDSETTLVNHTSPEPEVESPNSDRQWYDPNQPIEERREVRKGLRELNKEAADNRQDWLDPESTGIKDAVKRAGVLFQSVKQTSDATIDSRLLVTAGDLTYKKTQRIVLGDGASGIDVDEFVGKCISFMNRGADAASGSSRTQRHRPLRRATQADTDDEEEGPEAGDALNWEWLGARACFPSNLRPPVPGFLLGPLSVQKRIRTVRARRERLQRQGDIEAVRPDELRAADLQQAENSTLTAMCVKIKEQYTEIFADAEARLDAEVDDNTPTEETKALMDKYNLSDDGGIPLFRFALHPTSFGQTVENLFYVSFLIREGHFGIGKDENGFPTLHAHELDVESDPNITSRSTKHQAVFSIDFETWQELVRVFRVEKSLIPDRSGTGAAAMQIGTRGWYA